MGKKMRKVKVAAIQPIITGGNYTYNYWSAILYSDAVWIGHIFEFAVLNSIEDIFESKYYYTGNTGKDLHTSRYIDWSMVPVCKLSKKNAYYWGGVGYKNKCRFCMTTWTSQYNQNSDENIFNAKSFIESKRLRASIVNNLYNREFVSASQSMILEDYLKTIKMDRITRKIRLGVEFANEETRKKQNKPITNRQIGQAFYKAGRDNDNLKFYFISGYEPIQEWKDFFYEIGSIVEVSGHRTHIDYKFTSLTYEPYTPLYDEVKDINPDYYFVSDTYDELRNILWETSLNRPRVYIGQSFNNVACDMGIQLSSTKEQLDFWLRARSKVYKSSRKSFYDALFDSGVLNLPRHEIDTSGKIIKKAAKEHMINDDKL